MKKKNKGIKLVIDGLEIYDCYLPNGHKFVYTSPEGILYEQEYSCIKIAKNGPVCNEYDFHKRKSNEEREYLDDAHSLNLHIFIKNIQKERE